MFKSEYKWQHDYVRLASDTGFNFERQKSDTLDKNRISSIDIDRIIDERDFSTIENCIPHITKFVLDPDQAQILDANFVKTFRLSQLAIQYLLYCKKYLDNTLIIVKDEIKKVKEENKELNLFVNDLQGHIATLMKEIDEKPIFKCSHCDKIFSSEDFLQSHIKRRHSTPLREAETDKLQMEIKELKGRLNSAEKMIQQEQNEVENNFRDTELKKIEDLQQKFEELRLQVQSELKLLQTQHNFQEKYEKWVEKMAFQDKGSKGGDLIRRKESTTQTEIEAVLQDKSSEEKENVPELKQITDIGEALENKVTSSLEKIENQMQSFWKKLNEIEIHKKGNENLEYVKPIKPRSKYVLNTLSTEDEDESPKKKQKKVEKDKKQSPVKIVETYFQKSASGKIEPKEQEPHEDDTTTSETFPSEMEYVSKEEPKPQPAPRKHIQKKPETTEINIINDDLLDNFRTKNEDIMNRRLQALGVSPDWKGLPTRSFQRAMEIVDHQANLTKKNYPNYDYISKQIEKGISKKIEETKVKRKKSKESERKRSITNIKEKVLSPKIEIKNRKMYETDSESEQIHPKENTAKFSAPYNAVIEELKAVTSKYDSSDKSEIIVVKEETKNEDQTKGVLKSFPSVGSLTKKKVIFNLEKDIKDGESTTSITSSIFESTPRKEQQKKKEKEKDIEDLSDFDFSDM